MTGLTSFELKRREGSDDICIVRLSGRLATGADDDFLLSKAQEIKSFGCRRLIMDIGGLDSIGSAGIGFFVSLHTSMTKDAAGRFVLAGPSRRVLEVLTMTGLSGIIRMAPDLEAALVICAQQEGKAAPAG